MLRIGGEIEALPIAVSGKNVVSLVKGLGLLPAGNAEFQGEHDQQEDRYLDGAPGTHARGQKELSESLGFCVEGGIVSRRVGLAAIVAWDRQVRDALGTAGGAAGASSSQASF